MFELQLQLASKLMPEQKISSVPEFWDKLQQAIGSHTSILTHSAIDLDSYKTDQFVAGINFQRVLADSDVTNFAGISSKSGSLLSLRTRNSASNISDCFIVIHHDLIITISDAGIEVYD